MKWLRRRRGGSSTPGELEPTFQSLIDEHLLVGYDRQLRFGELVGDRDWRLDQERGFLQMGDDLTFPAQLLGTVSHSSRTWRWAWANESISTAMAVRARDLRGIGEARGIDVLTDADVSLSRIADGHELAMAAIGALDVDAYYRGPYPGGEAFILVHTGERGPRPDAARAAFVVTNALATLRVPIGRAMVESYLSSNGIPAVAAPDRILVGPESQTTFVFDDFGRIFEIKGVYG